MKGLGLIITLALGVLVASLAVKAQQPQKVYGCSRCYLKPLIKLYLYYQ